MKRIKLENGNYKKIHYHENGKIHYEYYYNSNGESHRLEGPAKNWYYKSGKIYNKDYWINGKEYSKKEFYKHSEVIKIININRNLKLLNKE